MTDWSTGLRDAHSIVLVAGETDRPGVEIGIVVTGGEAYVRAYRGPASHWYLATRSHRTGTVQLAGRRYPVTFSHPVDEPVLRAIDTAFLEKYGPESASILSEAGRAATVRISPR